MRYFFAGAEQNPFIKMLSNSPARRFMASLFFLSKPPRLFSDPRPDKLMMVDSGGYSARVAFKNISFDAYTKFLDQFKKKTFRGKLFRCMNLDSLSLAETLANQKKLEELGYNPIPVYHYSEFASGERELLQDYVEKYDYIAVGGVAGAGLRAGQKRRYLDYIFNLTRDKVKVHGLGMSSLKPVDRYPYYCMAEEHQILSKRGWLSLDEIKTSDSVLTICPDGSGSEWNRVESVHIFPVDGIKMYEFDNRTFRACVTPNHRWLVNKIWGRGHHSRRWEFRTTEELNSRSLIPRAESLCHDQDGEHPDWLVELVAWTWTEGHIRKRGNRRTYTIDISQSQTVYPSNVEMIKNALDRAKRHFCCSYFGRYCITETVLKNGNKKLTFTLGRDISKAIIGILGPKKEIPYSFLNSLSISQLRSFVNISILADGWVLPRAKEEDRCFSLAQKDGKNIEQFRYACILLGIPTTQTLSNNRGKRMVSVGSSNVIYIYPHHAKAKEVNYSGRVWCIQTKNKTFLTRYRDSVYFTGNTVDSSTWLQFQKFGASRAIKDERMRKWMSRNVHYEIRNLYEIDFYLKWEREMTRVWAKRGVVWDDYDEIMAEEYNISDFIKAISGLPRYVYNPNDRRFDEPKTVIHRG